MSTQLKLRRGTTAQHSTFTGAEGEITVDTTKDTVVVHDGSTAGGVPLAKESGSVLSPTSVTLSSGTANGVAYLNGSKVLTTGSALTFDGTNFRVYKSSGLNRQIFETGDASQSDLQLKNSGGSNYIGISPSGEFFYDARGATQNHVWQFSGSEQMRLTSTGLGIGTSSPLAKLHSNNSSSGTTALTAIFGNGAAAALNNGSAIFLNNSSDFNQSTYSARIASVITNGSTQASDLIFGLYNGSQGNDLMRLDSSGNLGLGVTPSAWNTSIRKAVQVGASASIAGTVGASSFIEAGANYYLNSSTVDTYIYSDYATKYRQLSGAHQWYTAPSGTAGNAISFTQAMTLDASGNLGVGTTTPDIFARSYSRVVGISNATGNTALCLNAPTSGACYVDLGVNSSRVFGIYADPNYYTSLSTTSALPLTFGTNNTERMRITSGGEVYIAGTTDQGAYNLQCNGTGVWGAGAYVNGSDAALKENVTTLDNSLGLINAMRPVTFTYKENYSKDRAVQTGFIAQELQEVLAGKDYLDGIVQAGPEHLNVAYQNLIPLLVKAVQELTARVAQLEGN